MTDDYGHDLTIVDACTYRGQGGSPTAVTMDNPTLDDDARRAVVCAVGTSRVAFVDSDTDSVRFFTMQGELTNNGLGTIAAQAFLLHRRGEVERRGGQQTSGRVFGITAVRRDIGIEVWFDQGSIDVEVAAPERLDATI